MFAKEIEIRGGALSLVDAALMTAVSCSRSSIIRSRSHREARESCWSVVKVW